MNEGFRTIGSDIKLAEDQPEVPARWRGIGIRVEDDVLVTDTGHEVLMVAVPKSTSDLYFSLYL